MTFSDLKEVKPPSHPWQLVLTALGSAIVVGSIVWAGGGKSEALETVQRDIAHLKTKAETIIAVDTRLGGMEDRLERIENKLERIIESRGPGRR